MLETLPEKGSRLTVASPFENSLGNLVVTSLEKAVKHIETTGVGMNLEDRSFGPM